MKTPARSLCSLAVGLLALSATAPPKPSLPPVAHGSLRSPFAWRRFTPFAPPTARPSSAEARTAPQPRPKGADSRLLAVLLGVHHGDGREIHDVLHFVAALEDVDGFVHPHQHRADSLCAAEALEQFVADVAGFEIRED
jgi:hypothetical protein